MSHTKESILAMEKFAAENDGKYPKFPTGNYLNPLPGDSVAIPIPDGATWEGFWMGGTNVSNTDTMFDYEIVHPATGVPMVAGQDYTYHLGGDAIIFTHPIVGPGEFKMTKRLQPRTSMKIRVVLLPRQSGHHIFSEEVLQDLLADAVGKTHSLRKLIADPEYDAYNFATVLEAELTDKGIEALVELG